MVIADIYALPTNQNTVYINYMYRKELQSMTYESFLINILFVLWLV